MKRFVIPVLAIMMALIGPLGLFAQDDSSSDKKNKEAVRERIRQKAMEAARNSDTPQKAAKQEVKERIEKLKQKSKEGGDQNSARSDDQKASMDKKKSSSNEKTDSGPQVIEREQAPKAEGKEESESDTSSAESKTSETSSPEEGESSSTDKQKKQVEEIMKQSEKAGPGEQPLAEPVQSEQVSEMLGQFSNLENERALLQRKIAVEELRKKLDELKGKDQSEKEKNRSLWQLSTTSGSPGDMNATLYIIGSGAEIQVQAGDPLPEGWKVAKIAPTYIKVKREGETRYHWLKGQGSEAGNGDVRQKLEQSLSSSGEE